MRLPTRLIPLGAAVAMAALISAVLANDAQTPPAAATAPIPHPAPSGPPAPQAATPAVPAPESKQEVAAPAAPAPESKQEAAAPAAPAPAAKWGREQLEQLVAPIALYPDQLLGQILMASTYPAEVVEAARWVRVPAHRRLKGEALAAALKPKGWDPSVMALVPFPQVLKVMSERLDWLRDLGTAFVAQQAEVMAAVQHLRHLAMAAGTLKTTPQCHCVVSTAGETITIATVASQPVCVPAYHSRIAYGSWPYADYPPIDFPVPYGVAFLPGFYIGFYPPIDVAWYGPLWGWDSIDWGAGSIIVDPGRYAVLAAGDPEFAGNVWSPNPGRWGAVNAARIGAAGAAAGMAAALPGMRGAAGRGGAAVNGPGAARAAAAAGMAPGRGGPHAGYGAVHVARGGAGARWGGHAGHAFAGHGGHFGGAHWGGHFGGRHFAGYGGHFGGPRGGGHFGGGGGPHFAMGGGGGGHGGGGGGPHGGGGGGGGHGGGGGGHGGGGHGH